MPLQHDALEHRAAARAAVRNELQRTGHSLEFHSAERVGLVSGCIRRLIKKAFHIFSIRKKKFVNFIVNLTSSCMVLMMIVC